MRSLHNSARWQTVIRSLLLMKFSVFLFFIGLGLSGCQQQRVTGKRYLNMDSLINEQVYYLTHFNASLNKEAVIGNNRSSSTSKLDSTTWSYELDVFRQLDLINRPIYRDVYQVTDRVKDPKSNLLIKSYEAQSGSPVPYLRVYYLDTPLRMKRLEALYQENNALYGSQRKLEMYFDGEPGRPFLKGYLIEGNQKMMLSDSVHYAIHSEVVLQ